MPQDFIISGQTLTDIGDAIREKGGAEGGLTPEAMPSAIRAIKTGIDEAALGGLSFAINEDDGGLDITYTYTEPEG